MKTFKIPKISYGESDGIVSTTNTIFPYFIRQNQGKIYVHYTDFSDPKNPRLPVEFRTELEAKEWIENIHYPNQIAKFLITV